MKKPIFRVFVSYQIKKKNAVTRRATIGTLDTFALTSDIEEIKNDQIILDRICYINKKKHDKVDVLITNVEIEGQYG